MMERNALCGNRWVAYFDILGFQKILSDSVTVATGLDAFVNVDYKSVLDELRRVGHYSPDTVSIVWFSDTFLLFTRDDSHRSLVSINQAATHFFEEVICLGLPLRRALGMGEFYTDPGQGIFVGRGLIDAYQCAEGQDWIGFVVTPNACAKLRQLDVALERWDYVEHPVSFKKQPSQSLYAYRPNGLCLENLLRSIEEIRDHTRNGYPQEYEERYRGKYDRTIVFLDSSTT